MDEKSVRADLAELAGRMTNRLAKYRRNYNRYVNNGKRVEDIQKEFVVGQDLMMKIVKLDPTEHRIGLSVKQCEMDAERGDLDEAKAKMEPFKKATLADAFAKAERQ